MAKKLPGFCGDEIPAGQTLTIEFKGRQLDPIKVPGPVTVGGALDSNCPGWKDGRYNPATRVVRVTPRASASNSGHADSWWWR